MMLTEGFSILQSFGLIVAASSTVFAWRLYSAKKGILQALKTIPTVVVIGPKLAGKSSFIKSLGFYQMSRVFGGVYKARGDGRVSMLELDLEQLNLKMLDNINLKNVFYIFDVSKDSPSIEKQIEDFENFSRNLKKGDCIPVATKIDVADKEKLKILEEKLGKVFKTSVLDLKKELEDIKTLQEMLKEQPVSISK